VAETTSDDLASTESVTLVSSRSKWWVFVGAGVGFAAVLLVNFSGNTSAMIMATLSVLVAVAGAAMLLPGSNSLQLDAQGFQVTHFFRATHYRWSDVSDFGVHSFGQSGEVVAFKMTDAPRNVWGKINASLLGERNTYLPDTYGMTAEDLARLMTARQSRA
jgi:hypothetical protein